MIGSRSGYVFGRDFGRRFGMGRGRLVGGQPRFTTVGRDGLPCSTSLSRNLCSIAPSTLQLPENLGRAVAGLGVSFGLAPEIDSSNSSGTTSSRRRRRYPATPGYTPGYLAGREAGTTNSVVVSAFDWWYDNGHSAAFGSPGGGLPFHAATSEQGYLAGTCWLPSLQVRPRTAWFRRKTTRPLFMLCLMVRTCTSGGLGLPSEGYLARGDSRMIRVIFCDMDLLVKTELIGFH